MAKSGAVRDIPEGNAVLHKQKAVAVGDAGYQGNEERSDAKAGGVKHPFG